MSWQGTPTITDLIIHISNITDPRSAQGKRHQLVEIMIIAICGVICGADDWVMIGHFGKAKKEWFESSLSLPHGIQEESFDRYIEKIDKVPPAMPMIEVNKVFFFFLGEQDMFMERLICSPSYRVFCNKMFTMALRHNHSRYNPYAHLSQAKQNIVNNFLATSSLDIYRQWVADGKVIPLDELTELSGNLLSNGVSSILQNGDPETG